jgi:tRNA pseudouridine38-40 synthase
VNGTLILYPSTCLTISHRSCDSRKYTYFFPSYMLIPPKPGSGLHEALGRHASSSATSEPASAPAMHPFWEGQDPASTAEDDLVRKRQWRCSPEHIATLRATAARFEKTHNFHNFTVGRDFNDRSCERFMKSIEVRSSLIVAYAAGLT